MKRISIFFMVLMLAVVLMGCETVKGLGKDIENTGSAVQRSLSR
jgi:predicted small secreted protein